MFFELVCCCNFIMHDRFILSKKKKGQELNFQHLKSHSIQVIWRDLYTSYLSLWLCFPSFSLDYLIPAIKIFLCFPYVGEINLKMVDLDDRSHFAFIKKFPPKNSLHELKLSGKSFDIRNWFLYFGEFVRFFYSGDSFL